VRNPLASILGQTHIDWHMQVGSIVNFSLMYMLAKTPSRAMGAGSRNVLKALFDTNTLKRMGAPGTFLQQCAADVCCLSWPQMLQHLLPVWPQAATSLSQAFHSAKGF